MSWQRLVEWVESLAIANPTAFQSYSARYSCSIQIRSARAGNFDLSARGQLPDFHLDKKNPPYLVYLYFGNARGHRIADGIVSFRVCDDRHEYRGLWCFRQSASSGCDCRRGLIDSRRIIVGMSAAEQSMEERVERLHSEGIIDMHFDLPMDLYEKRERKNILATEFLPEFLAGNISVIGAAIYI